MQETNLLRGLMMPSIPAHLSFPSNFHVPFCTIFALYCFLCVFPHQSKSVLICSAILTEAEKLKSYCVLFYSHSLL